LHVSPGRTDCLPTVRQPGTSGHGSITRIEPCPFPVHLGGFRSDGHRKVSGLVALRYFKADSNRIWQQIGNTIARAAATRLQCEQVRHRRKWRRIIDLATSTQCHAHSKLKQGIQVRILVPRAVVSATHLAKYYREFNATT
jgi:hypothetical protein